MSRRYQQGCLYREKRKTGSDVWVFRYRDSQRNRKEQIGTVEQFPSRKAAMKSCELLRANINRETRAPRTVAELVLHYRLKEMAEISSKSYSTAEHMTPTSETGLCQFGAHVHCTRCGLWPLRIGFIACP